MQVQDDLLLDGDKARFAAGSGVPQRQASLLAAIGRLRMENDLSG